VLLRDVRFRLRPRDGTLDPFSLASFRPIAIACLRLVTFRPDPLFNDPRLRRCIADFTDFDAPLPYFAMDTSTRGRVASTVLGWRQSDWWSVVGGWWLVVGDTEAT
jgi:hypothetical protein